MDFKVKSKISMSALVPLLICNPDQGGEEQAEQAYRGLEQRIDEAEQRVQHNSGAIQHLINTFRGIKERYDELKERVVAFIKEKTKIIIPVLKSSRGGGGLKNKRGM